MPTKTERSYYAVRRGRRRGIFPTWPEAQQYVHGWRHAEHERFDTLEEAEAYLLRLTVDEYRAVRRRDGDA